MSWAKTEGSWGASLDEMKEESERRARDAIREIATLKNGGVTPLCCFCNKCVSKEMKSPDKINLEGRQTFAHEQCYKTVRFHNKMSDRI